MEKVAILGASENPERYSNKAMKKLVEHGHQVLLVAPGKSEIEGRPVVPRLADLKEKVDTLTMYVGPKISSGLADDIVALGPKRVIFNPGSENPELEKVLDKNGIAFEEACTLVLLATGQF